jgi:hypothetical protein
VAGAAAEALVALEGVPDAEAPGDEAGESAGEGPWEGEGPGAGLRVGAKHGMRSSAPPRFRVLRLGRFVSSWRAEP